MKNKVIAVQGEESPLEEVKVPDEGGFLEEGRLNIHIDQNLINEVISSLNSENERKNPDLKNIALRADGLIISSRAGIKTIITKLAQEKKTSADKIKNLENKCNVVTRRELTTGDQLMTCGWTNCIGDLLVFSLSIAAIAMLSKISGGGECTNFINDTNQQNQGEGASEKSSYSVRVAMGLAATILAITGMRIIANIFTCFEYGSRSDNEGRNL